jgi:hypothetical protein
MKVRGRPFEKGNQMGRGRPKGSRKKSKSAVQQLLEQSEVPLIALCIRQGLQGHFGSLRLAVGLLQSLLDSRSKRSRIGKMQTMEDLLSVSEHSLQQMSRGEITPEEAKTRMQGVEQMGQLIKQNAAEQRATPRPKEPLPEFMRVALEAAQEERVERKARERKEALERDGIKPPDENL